MNPSVTKYNGSYEQVKNLKESWSDFINGYPWKWFVTLTFRNKVSRKTANRKWNKWFRMLEKELNDEIGYFRATELQKARNVLHFHALLLNIEKLEKYSTDSYLRAEKWFNEHKDRENIDQLAVRFYWMEKWNEIAGFARIYKYDETKGAHFYLTKYLTKELSDYKLGGSILRT